MSRRRIAKPQKPVPYKVAARSREQTRNALLKRASRELEHSREIDVAIGRFRRLSHSELERRQTKYLIGIIKEGKSQQAFRHVAGMTPVEFRDFIIDKLTHNHT